MGMHKDNAKTAIIHYSDEPRTLNDYCEYLFDVKSRNSIRIYLRELIQEELLFEGPRRGKEKTYINYQPSRLEASMGKITGNGTTPGYKFIIPASYTGKGKTSWPNLHQFLKLDPVANANPLELLVALIFLATQEQGFVDRDLMNELSIQRGLEELDRMLRVLVSITSVLVTKPEWRNELMKEELQVTVPKGKDVGSWFSEQWKIAVAAGVIKGEPTALEDAIGKI